MAEDQSLEDGTAVDYKNSYYKPGHKMGEYVLSKRLSLDGDDQVWLAENTRTKERVTINIHLSKELEQKMINGSAEAELLNKTGKKTGDTFDCWTLGELIGIGTNGEVWSAKHLSTGQQVALKICTTKMTKRQNGFLKEIKILNRLQADPGIINLYNYKIQLDPAAGLYPWLAMPLANHIESHLYPDFSVTRTIAAIIEYISIVLRLHSYGIYYYDIKPSNCVVKQGQYILIDFNDCHLVPYKDMDVAFAIITGNFIKLFELFLGRANYPLDTIPEHFRECKHPEALRAAMIDWLKGHAESQYTHEIAGLLYRNHMAEDALFFCKRWLKEAPQNPDAHFMMALSCQELDLFEEAERHFEAILKKQSMLTCYIAYAGCKLKEKQFKAAAKIINKGLEKHPQAKQLLSLKGEINQQLEIDKKQAKIKQTHKHTLNDADLSLLESPFKKKPEIVSAEKNRLLIHGDFDNTQNDSYATVSWDQYFHDLSIGAFRNSVYDGKFRPYRTRTWHYIIKNLKLVDSIFNLNKEKLNILDIGCSSGYLSRLLEGNYSLTDPQKLYYWGIDIREEPLVRAVHGKNDLEAAASIDGKIPSVFLQQDISRGLPFKDNTFDVIVNFEMIKYLTVEHGEGLLNEINRVLSPGGLLFISTSFGTFKPGYIQGYDHEQFKSLLQQSGFNIRAIRGSQCNFNTLQNGIKPEHQVLFDALVACHPPEVVAAMMAPLYPERSNHVVYEALSH